ncbi:unnamed protein product, partial [marine sediment metagenome]
MTRTGVIDEKYGRPAKRQSRDRGRPELCSGCGIRFKPGPGRAQRLEQALAFHLQNNDRCTE